MTIEQREYNLRITDEGKFCAVWLCLDCRITIRYFEMSAAMQRHCKKGVLNINESLDRILGELSEIYAAGERLRYHTLCGCHGYESIIIFFRISGKCVLNLSSWCYARGT